MQAAYYLPTAVIPFLSRSAFERVTGRKTEWWLVLTVSALVGAVGAALAVSVRAKPETETVVLGAGAAAGLGLIDVTYVSRRRASGEQSSAMTPTSQPSARSWRSRSPTKSA